MSLKFLLALILPLITVEVIKRVYTKLVTVAAGAAAAHLSTRTKLFIGLIVTPVVQVAIMSGIIGIPVQFIEPINIVLSTIVSQGIYNIIHELIKQPK